jgi:competence protein ComEC
VPAALALTAGIVLDRYAGIPMPISVVAFVAALCAWFATCTGQQRYLSLIYLAVTIAAFGVGYHHWFRDFYSEDDIGQYAPDEPRPVKLRGIIAEEPFRSLQRKGDPLKSFPRPDPIVTVIEVSHLHDRHGWIPVSGQAQLVVVAKTPDASKRDQITVHVGDEVEVVGRIIRPQPPANPGEFDYASALRDQQILAIVSIAKTEDAPEGLRLIAQGTPWSPKRALAIIRGWGTVTLQEALPEEISGLAVALILGDSHQMGRWEWNKYMLTGVIHVLAISGQHLVILGGFLWITLRLLGVRRRRGAWFIALFLLFYALLAGGRPPVMRSAVTVCVVCLGLTIGRLALSANSFALAWIIVLLLNPTDCCNAGCLLSFLSVAVLYWGFSRKNYDETDPLEPVIEECRPRWLKLLGRLFRPIAISYWLTVSIWLALAPLVASLYHTVPLVGILIGPPLVLLTAVALLSGFLLLFSQVFCWPLVPVFALPTSASLAACKWIVDTTVDWPAAYFYAAEIPAWWLWVYYPTFLAVLMLPALRRRWRWALLAGLAWLCLGLLLGWIRGKPHELRCTFLAVGHGGCTVLETPDGRTLLYDAGAINGPDVASRQIAPFLWRQGVRRIDEIFLSHADLDHFNGLPALLDGFGVGQVTCTPTFAEKTTPAVKFTLAAIKDRGIPVHIVRAGDRLSAGEVTLHVLHPPPLGPDGKENFRSMVLLVQHAGHAIMLTGDLEGPGMDRVQRLPPPRVDVLMAPHHGSRTADTPGLARKVRPKIVISCQGPPRGATRPNNPKLPGNVSFWGTWPHGAITVHSERSSLWVETYVTRQRLTLVSKDGQGRN